jgi:exodeoxyribonuclease V beta subunit
MSNPSEERKDFDVFNVELSGSTLVEASAGTGKTWSSTALYLRMVVEQTLLPKNILVVTFTKAATAELAGRVRERLQGMLNYLQSGSSSRDEDFYSAMLTKWQTESIDKNMIVERLQSAISHFDEAAIYTIHSFCQRLLNDFAFEAGAKFDLKPLSDDSEYVTSVAQDYWRQKMDILTEEDKPFVQWLIEKKQSPNALLKSISKHKEKPYLELFHAVDPEIGIEENSALVASLEEPQQLTAETVAELHANLVRFWNESSEQITDCFDGILASGNVKRTSYNPDKRDSYFDSLNRLLTSDPFRWTNASQRNAGDKFYQSKLNAAVRKGATIPQHDFFIALDNFAIGYKSFQVADKKYKQANSQLSNNRDALYKYRLAILLEGMLEYININLPKEKQSKSLLSFNDILLNVYNALDGEQGDNFAAAVSSQFSAAIIDEFQDTDPLQSLIFRRLFADQGTILFLVGDPKQAIYSFRGADIYAYYQAAKETSKQLTLRTNFRSTPALVDSVNALFKTTHPAFMTSDIHYDWVNAKSSAKLSIEGDTDASLTFSMPVPEDGKYFNRDNADPWAVGYTAQKIAELLDKSNRGEAVIVNSEGSRAIKPGDFAVLVSSHNDALKVKSALDALGIPSVRQSQEKVTDSIAALTMLRLIQAVAEPSNESRIVELLADPLLAMDAAEIVSLKENDTQWDNVLEDFWILQTCWIEQGFSRMFRQWLNGVGFLNRNVASRLLKFAEGERNLTDLLHLAEIIQTRSGQQGGIQSLISWLQYAITNDSSEEEWQVRLESDSGRVKISTIHASKGLEYNIVFCPFLWAGRGANSDAVVAAHSGTQPIVDFGSEHFDEHQQLATQEALMEQLRLLYVALTRPVHRCYVFWPYQKLAGTSALAWLLYGTDEMAASDDPVKALKNKVTRLSFEDFSQAVKGFVDDAKTRNDTDQINFADIVCHQLNERPSKNAIKMDEAEQRSLVAAPQFKRSLYPSWWQTSFSGLTQGQHVEVSRMLELPERCDDVVVDQNEQTESDDVFTIFNLPRGAHTGNGLHAIFEFWNFSRHDQQALDELILSQLDAYDIGKVEDRTQWCSVVAECVTHTLNTPLDGKNLRLNQLPVEQRQPEMEFLLSTNGSLDRIVAVLSNPRFGLPKVFVEASQQLDSKQLNGFLVGFIDLTFQDDDGRFHVLDWKSNYLGDSFDHYRVEFQENAMAGSHYYLQALIYLVALHRYLKQQLVDYDPEQHFGSAWYLFVRGINGEPNNGIYNLSPSIELIEALDKALLSVGVAK